jgi:ABC-type transport system involved in cytochrome c biogenesis permease subunit
MSPASLSGTSGIAHYYGDIVRKLFLAIGFIMLVSFPFFRERIDVPLYFSLGAIITLDIFAAATSPRMKWVAYTESIVALFGCIIFEYLAVRDISVIDPLFWINQVIAVLFFFALYYAVKTARSAAMGLQSEQTRIF